jgi:hypothetical protein
MSLDSIKRVVEAYSSALFKFAATCFHGYRRTMAKPSLLYLQRRKTRCGGFLESGEMAKAVYA